MDRDGSWLFIEEHRCSLANLVESLSEKDWERQSLCDGWRVKDVVAHIALTPQAPSFLSMVPDIARARGDFNRLNYDIVVRHAQRPADQIVAELRQFASSRRLPIVTNYQNIVVDILVHEQDIAIPLDIRREMPTAAATTAATRIWKMGWPFWARRTLRGFRLTATDTDWTVGDGASIEGPIGALLLVLTGRPAALPMLTGEGVPALTNRMGR